MGTGDKLVFDREEMLDRLGGDVEFLDDVLAVFLDESPKMMEAARGAVHDGDARRVERSAHTLKGALMNVAAEPAAALAARLETLGREQCLDECPRVLAALETAIARLEQTLRDRIPHPACPELPACAGLQ